MKGSTALQWQYTRSKSKNNPCFYLLSSSKMSQIKHSRWNIPWSFPSLILCWLQSRALSKLPCAMYMYILAGVSGRKFPWTRCDCFDILEWWGLGNQTKPNKQAKWNNHRYKIEPKMPNYLSVLLLFHIWFQ